MPSQTSSLNGSLGPVPAAFGTESQSHISPHAYLETQVRLQPDCCSAASAPPVGCRSWCSVRKMHSYPHSTCVHQASQS